MTAWSEAGRAPGLLAPGFWPFFQGLTLWLKVNDAGAAPLFLSRIWISISDRATRGATWMVSMTGLAQKNTDTQS